MAIAAPLRVKFAMAKCVDDGQILAQVVQLAMGAVLVMMLAFSVLPATMAQELEFGASLAQQALTVQRMVRQAVHRVRQASMAP
jgi:hypothetical protein